MVSLVKVLLQETVLREPVERELQVTVPEVEENDVPDPPLVHEVEPPRLRFAVAWLARYSASHAQRRVLTVRSDPVRFDSRLTHLLRDQQ